MKKLLLLIGAIGFAFFVSCEKKSAEGPKEPSVIGEWSPVKWSFARIIDGEVDYEYVINYNEDEDVPWKRIFAQDGTGYVMSNFRSGDDKDNWQKTESFDWTFSDRNILFTNTRFINPPGMELETDIYFFETEWFIQDLSLNELVVSYSKIHKDDPNECTQEIVIFEKIN